MSHVIGLGDFLIEPGWAAFSLWIAKLLCCKSSSTIVQIYLYYADGRGYRDSGALHPFCCIVLPVYWLGDGIRLLPRALRKVKFAGRQAIFCQPTFRCQEKDTMASYTKVPIDKRSIGATTVFVARAVSTDRVKLKYQSVVASTSSLSFSALFGEPWTFIPTFLSNSFAGQVIFGSSCA